MSDNYNSWVISGTIYTKHFLGLLKMLPVSCQPRSWSVTLREPIMLWALLSCIASSHKCHCLQSSNCFTAQNPSILQDLLALLGFHLLHGTLQPVLKHQVRAQVGTISQISPSYIPVIHCLNRVVSYTLCTLQLLMAEG